MTRVYSLRARLTLIILIPLIAVTLLVGLWQLQNARATANDVFNRSLQTVALAITNDVAISGGDALSVETSQLLENSSNGPVFYHVYAPDGVIVAGYATPPVGIPKVETTLARPLIFDGIYQGREVSGVRLQNRMQIEGFSGVFTTTVWQDRNVRERFVFDLLLRALLGLLAVIASLAIIVWFGVRVGVSPLLQLEEAIERRSSDDLSSIKRAVPDEVSGIVETLNRLFVQVEATLEAQSQFIANAAHQLRNPIAGVLSLAEAVHSAKTPEDMKARSEDLLDAARKTSELTQRLLLHEQARALSPSDQFVALDVQTTVESWVADFSKSIPRHITFDTSLHAEGAKLRADPILLKEAVANLIDNALRHSGPQLSRIEFGVDRVEDGLTLWVEDDGVGLDASDIATALTRFAQVKPNEGSGLGLSITQAVIEGHGGTFQLIPKARGLQARIDFADA